MATTRHEQRADIHLCAMGERPRLFLDCGCWRGSFWFDDCVELRAYLTHAIRNDGLPEWAAQQALDYALNAFGHWDDSDCDTAKDTTDIATSRRARTPQSDYSKTARAVRAAVWLCALSFWGYTAWIWIDAWRRGQ